MTSGSSYGWLIYRLPYVTQQPYVSLFHFRHLLTDASGNLMRQSIIDFPNMANRILHILALVDEDMVVYKYWHKKRRRWTYKVEWAGIFQMDYEKGILTFEKERK